MTQIRMTCVQAPAQQAQPTAAPGPPWPPDWPSWPGRHSDEPYWLLSVGYLLVGIGVGLVNPPVTTTAVSALPADQAGLGPGSPAPPVRSAACWAWPCPARSSSAATTPCCPALSPPCTSPRDRANRPASHRHRWQLGRRSTCGPTPAVAHTVGVAFTEASHWGFLLGAGSAALAGLIASFTLKPIRPPGPRDAAAPRAPEGGLRDDRGFRDPIKSSGG